jgi:hypothetical protein
MNNMNKIAVMDTNPKIYIAISLLDEEWALRVHSQTLGRLAERGGMSHEEIVANVEKLHFSAISAIDKSYALKVVEKLAIKSINLINN